MEDVQRGRHLRFFFNDQEIEAYDEVSGLINATGGFRTGIVAAPLMAELVAQVIAGEELRFPIDSFLDSRFAACSSERTSRAFNGHNRASARSRRLDFVD